MGTLMRQSGPKAGFPFSNLTKGHRGMAAKMKELAIKPEMECYSQSMYRDVRNLVAMGLVAPPYYVQLRARHGVSGAIEATPETLMSMYQFLPADCYFNRHGGSRNRAARDHHGPHHRRGRACGPRRQHLLLAGCAGQEQSHSIVERVVRIAAELNTSPTTPDEAREILGVVKK